MSTPATTSTPANKNKPANGNVPAAVLGGADTGAGTDAEKRSRGVIPTMPAAIVYKLGERVHAVIHHPADGSSYAESGKGEGSAKGALEDAGYRLSPLYTDGHEWLAAKLPEGASLIGYANIKGFPLLPQHR